MTEQVESSIAIAPGESLPFFPKKQEALLGHLMQNDQFFLQARSRLVADWFADAYCQKLWRAKQEFYEAWKRSPNSLEEFKGLQTFMKEDMGTRNRLYAQMTKCIVASKEYGLDVLRNELTNWLKARTFKAYTEKMGSLYNEEKYDAAFQTLALAHMKVSQASFESEPVVDFSDVTGAFFTQKGVDLENALTFGCPLVDQKLNGDCINDAALLRGDMTVLLAPTNVGKTTTMVTCAVHNVRRRRAVLFITHEGRPEDIKSKVLCAMTGKTYAQLVELTMSEAGQNYLQSCANILTRYFVYIPLNKPGMTVEDVEVAIRRAQEKRIAETGSGFDLIIDDYPAKLSTVLAMHGHWPKRQADEYVYNFFTQIALEFKCHVMTAIQTNREGSKVNQHRKGAEERLVTMEDVMESWGAMTTATNVISLNRDEVAQAKNRITFHICKSRSGDTGWSIVSKTNYNTATTHGPKLSATFYRGMSTMVDSIDGLLEQYAGKSIPETHYYL